MDNLLNCRLLQVLCYNITSGCMGYLLISQGIWSIFEHLCYSITLRLLDTLDSLWIHSLNSRLPVDNFGCTVHKVATRALEDVTGGLSLWISPRKPVISGIWPVDKSAGASVRLHLASYCFTRASK